MRNPRGRPTAMTKAVVGKLEEAFALDCTVKEACHYANISTDTYYAHLKENKDFSDRIAGLRTLPILAARMSVLEAIKKDGNLALKYLERKCPTEFSVRHLIIHRDISEKWWKDDEANKAGQAFSTFFGEFLEHRKKNKGGKSGENVG